MVWVNCSGINHRTLVRRSRYRKNFFQASVPHDNVIGQVRASQGSAARTQSVFGTQPAIFAVKNVVPPGPPVPPTFAEPTFAEINGELLKCGPNIGLSIFVGFGSASVAEMDLIGQEIPGSEIDETGIAFTSKSRGGQPVSIGSCTIGGVSVGAGCRSISDASPFTSSWHGGHDSLTGPNTGRSTFVGRIEPTLAGTSGP